MFLLVSVVQGTRNHNPNTPPLHHAGVEWLLGLYIFLGAVFVPFWAWVTKKFDKKMTLTIITLVQFSVLGLIFVAVERQALGMYVACIISAGSVMGGSSVVRFSMMADVADALQLLTRGHRDEAKIVALFDLLVALGFLVIDISGFRADMVPQSHSARLAIRIFYSLVPSILALFSAMVIWAFYPLDRNKHAEILVELSLQKAEPALNAKVLGAEEGAG